MKKSYLILTFLLLSLVGAVSAQSDKVNNITYLVGCEKIPGYNVLTVRTDSVNFDITKTNAPVLANYEKNKKLYIGGYMVNEKGDSTIIKDIKMSDSAGVVTFKVIGKDFTRQITTKSSSNYLLSVTPLTSVFYTDGVGIWKINKKKI
jgi:hypothetical protein